MTWYLSRYIQGSQCKKRDTHVVLRTELCMVYSVIALPSRSTTSCSQTPHVSQRLSPK